MTALPAIFAALIIIVVGWIVALLVAKGLARLLRVIRFNELGKRARIDQFLERAQIKLDPAGDLVAGWTLSVQLNESDEVTIGEDQGTVVRVGPTSTTIETEEREIILPNSVVAQSRIAR